MKKHHRLISRARAKILPDGSLTPLPVPRTAPPSTPAGRWLDSGPRVKESHSEKDTRPWHQVLWLTGVDYFSTLGYQPGIALLAAGAVSPLATLVLVAVTLLFALPMYRQVASRSFAGQGSLAMLENLLPGWWGKGAVLVLLGFAGTAFVITMTISCADAATHALENPLLAPLLGGQRIGVTLVFLAVLAWIFLKGFQEAIGVARMAAVPYLFLNLVVVLRCGWEILTHPEHWEGWKGALSLQADASSIVLVSLLVFPRLALGLSGFETGVAVMPQVRGDKGDAGLPEPKGRIRNTQKLLATAALIMSFFLLSSSLVTTLLIPEEAYRQGGPAAGRALAYLAHLHLGSAFGTLYDLSTIFILGFAGASAMTGLLHLIPRYLPRFGMAPQWTSKARPLVLLLFGVNILVTFAFGADVESQAGAYATGILALMLSAAVAVALAFLQEFRTTEEGRGRRLALSLYFWVATAVFLFAFLDNVAERPDGLVIAALFIFGVLSFGGLSRYFRATEMRVADIRLEDEESVELFRKIRGRKVFLVPIRDADAEGRDRKARELRKHHRVRDPLAFLHVKLLDNRSEFLASLGLRIRKEGPDYVLTVTGAVAVANTIAYVSELLDPKQLFLSLSRKPPMSQAFRYIFWGEGEVGLQVYSILIKYWNWTPPGDIRPLIVMVSD